MVLVELLFTHHIDAFRKSHSKIVHPLEVSENTKYALLQKYEMLDNVHNNFHEYDEAG